jgi:hypothetical protein
LKDNERISFFAEIDPSMNLTLEGVFKDMIAGLSQIGKLKHYYRVALVTDKGWMANIARVEGLVFSSIDLRVFAPDERDKAFAWAAETPEPFPVPEEPTQSLHLIHTTSESVFAYQIEGRIREKDVEIAVNAIREAFNDQKKINVLARIRTWKGFDLASILSDDLFKLKYEALSKVDKYAVVGGPPWTRNLLELVNSVITTEIRVFDESAEEAAWEWVGASQVLLPE